MNLQGLMMRIYLLLPKEIGINKKGAFSRMKALNFNDDAVKIY